MQGNGSAALLTSLKAGFHLAIDYGYLDREFYARPRGTLMCYWHHQLSEDPYVRIGEQDITAHVNFSDLIEAGRAAALLKTEFSTQMDFLIRLGILDEMESLRSGMPSMTSAWASQAMANGARRP